MEKIIDSGAEAKIYLRNNKIIKNRIPKSYRLPILDEKLRRIRTKKEAKILEILSKLIAVPNLIKKGKYELEIEYIKGKKLSNFLDKTKEKAKIAESIGKNLAIIHNYNIIHGDLTTSNMIYKQDLQSKSNLRKDKLYFIDFGLSQESSKIEDKAVDLHILKETLKAKNYKNADKLWKGILDSYKKNSSNSNIVLKQLDKVESRGRYKQQF
jgi:Kae1-associated kinase Bud32